VKTIALILFTALSAGFVEKEKFLGIFDKPQANGETLPLYIYVKICLGEGNPVARFYIFRTKPVNRISISFIS